VRRMTFRYEPIALLYSGSLSQTPVTAPCNIPWDLGMGGKSAVSGAIHQSMPGVNCYSFDNHVTVMTVAKTVV
jgi:hypothetical protein